MKRREFLATAGTGILVGAQAVAQSGGDDSACRPAGDGFPSRDRLSTYDIWDSYFTPSHSSPGPNGGRLMKEIEETMPLAERNGFQRLCYFPHVGLGTTDSATEAWLRVNPKAVLEPLKRWPDKLMGMIQLNANDLRGSLDALNRWLRDGPMLGVYFSGGSRGALVCTHRNCARLFERVAELDGVIMQHTWFIAGGKTRPGMSTPSELAQVAARYPEIQFVCAHAGGEWEKGIRAIRALPNILAETSGFDPTAGFIEMAVRELGAERIIFGSHLPSRSLGTELSKVVAARISERDKKLILGANYRELLAPILKKKGRN
jgi:predicted TIM-barrel fold metal-dependent hydrolase